MQLVIRGGPNSEHFLSNLRKLLKRGKFFLTTQSLIVKRNWVYINQFIKTCFLKKNFYLLDTFLDGFLLKTKPRADPEISRREGGFYKQKQPFTKIFFWTAVLTAVSWVSSWLYMIKLFGKYKWRSLILVILQAYSLQLQ